MKSSIGAFLQTDRLHCDVLLSDAETLVQASLWIRAARIMDRFDDAFRRHLLMEENILFPALEQYNSNILKPTVLMRREHRRLCRLAAGVARAIKQRHARRFLAAAGLLRLAMAAHCIKEEGVLFRMADHVLHPAARFLIGEMHALKCAPGTGRASGLHG
jgi:iron-sulfur cluster repair protein YtfE (RIC family)